MGNLAFILLGLCCGFYGVFGHGMNHESSSSLLYSLSLHVFIAVYPRVNVLPQPVVDH